MFGYLNGSASIKQDYFNGPYLTAEIMKNRQYEQQFLKRRKKMAMVAL